MAYYHPEIQYHDFFQNRVVGYAELREYLQASMPREADEAIEHTDRIRADGDTAFIQYRITLRGGQGLVSFRTSEAITVRDGLIWRVNEYASLVHEQPTQALRPTVSRLGLSPQQLGYMANDLQQYFERQQPYLDGAGPAAGREGLWLQSQPDVLPAEPGAGAELLSLRQPGATPAFAGRAGLRHTAHQGG